MSSVEFQLNGQPVAIEADPSMPLLWALRENLRMTGTKFGCGMGLCGACTVHVDGVATRSCTLPLQGVAGRSVTTIEGLDAEHPLFAAWVEHKVPQCGYCQSGQVMAAAALLAENPSPDRQQVRNALSGNLCRCGTYNRIQNAVLGAAEVGHWEPGAEEEQA
ncbi:(2Fe-2S)-binding protein [Haliea atlantica]